MKCSYCLFNDSFPSAFFRTTLNNRMVVKYKWGEICKKLAFYCRKTMEKHQSRNWLSIHSGDFQVYGLICEEFWSSQPLRKKNSDRLEHKNQCVFWNFFNRFNYRLSNIELSLFQFDNRLTPETDFLFKWWPDSVTYAYVIH